DSGTSSADAVFFAGRESGPFNFYAGRRPASRSVLPCVFVNDRLSREVLTDLARVRPLYILDGFRPDAGCPYGPARPALDALLAKYYNYEGRLHFVDIYRLR
ncbi:MAG TPA: hypothetical protein VFT91_04520, partial [Dehalococcoidia bacterium]|nr:hypothetical protein [Dehalococcoidia bacterium]